MGAQAISSSALGLEPVSTFTTLRSVAEVNTTPTSFSPFGPNFGGFGISTAAPTIGGVYLGTQGTGPLSFRVSKGGTHGVDDLEVELYDPSGDFVEKVRVKKNDPLDETYLLSNGLTLSLGAGDLVELDDFTVDVDAALPTSYSPSDPLWNGASRAPRSPSAACTTARAGAARCALR